MNKWLRGNGRKCTVCGGTGSVSRSGPALLLAAPAGRFSLGQRNPCDDCQGSGRVAFKEQEVMLRQTQGVNS